MTGPVWTVARDSAGVRLDKFLSDSTRLGTRGRAVAALERGKVFVNDEEEVNAARPLAAGDQVRVWMDRPGSRHRRSGLAAGGVLPIVYEDEHLIVVNKPPGLLTVPLERREGAPSVQDLLADHFRARGRRRPFVVHRIDRDTSGLVLFAARADVQQQLKDQFRRREPERVYLAVVYGRPAPPAGTWRDRLVWDQKALVQKETHPRDPRGKDALSEYRTVETFREASLVEVRLITGKRNQIRLQARLRGHTLVGEQRYTYGPEELRPVPFGRQALHAWKLGFAHPLDGRPLRFEAPLPSDMMELLGRLRRAIRQG
jgi:23S rRNA pseudouridine1911/1915/1917 synthase